MASTLSKSFSASTLTHLAVVSKSTQESVSPLGHKNRRLAGRKKFVGCVESDPDNVNLATDAVPDEDIAFEVRFIWKCAVVEKRAIGWY